MILAKKDLHRFWAKVDKDCNIFTDFAATPCWEWIGCTWDGYGQFRLNRKTVKAHRVAYELILGEIPGGLQLDHLCRNRSCVNPEHLEPVIWRENIRRGIHGEGNSIKTHCPQGHPYDEANTRYCNGSRFCRTCDRELHRRKKLCLSS